MAERIVPRRTCAAVMASWKRTRCHSPEAASKISRGEMLGSGPAPAPPATRGGDARAQRALAATAAAVPAGRAVKRDARRVEAAGTDRLRIFRK